MKATLTKLGVLDKVAFFFRSPDYPCRRANKFCLEALA